MTRSRRGFAAAVLSLLAITRVVPASAQIIEFEDAEIFRPTTDGGDFITVYDSDALPQRRFHLGVYGDYARNPIEIQFLRSGDTFSRLVENQGTVQLSGAIGLLPRWEVGIRAPFYIQNIDDVQLSTGEQIEGGTEANAGDISLNTKVTLLNRRNFGFGIAVLPEITLPTGNRREFAGTGELGYGGFLVLDAAPTPQFSLAFNAGGFIRDDVGAGPFSDPDDHFNDQLRLGAAMAYHFNERLTAIVEGYSAADTDSPFSAERKTPFDAIGGLRFHLGPVDLTVGGGAGGTRGQGSPDFRAFVGITTPKPKYDEDVGIGANLLQDSAKTYAVSDRDGDGRTSPGDILEYRINLVNSGDRAATNVVVEDAIPDRTRFVPGSIAIDGVPMSDAPDTDGADFSPGPPAKVTFRLPIVDAAPGKKEALLSFQVEIDRDITEITTIVNQALVSADGVAQFPLPAASTTVFPAIAEHEHVIVGPDRLELTEEIHFEFDKSIIRRESYPILKELASVLRQYPDLRVRIVGHTDSVGSDDYNQRLSERRALSVRDFLVGSGIEKERLEYLGRGESEPIASNDTATGRAMNRRTEFPVLNPDALKNKVIDRQRYEADLAPASEPEWLKRGERRPE